MLDPNRYFPVFLAMLPGVPFFQFQGRFLCSERKSEKRILPGTDISHLAKRKIIDSKVPAGSGFILGTLERGNGSPTVFEKASKLNHQVTGMNAKFHQGLGALLNTWHLSY